MSIKKIHDDFDFSERLTIARKKSGMNQKDLSADTGISVPSLSRYERGDRIPSVDVSRKLASSLMVSLQWLLTGEGPMLETPPPEPSNVEPYFDPRPTIRVPLISWVQAGEWELASDPFQPGDGADWLETSATASKHAFALTVHGDSMAPEFNPGDQIVVDPDRRGENGQFVIAKNGAGEATFKQLVIDGASVYLKPFNDRYPIKDMTGIEFRIVGVVVEKRKRYC